jgi:hypothetical protein
VLAVALLVRCARLLPCERVALDVVAGLLAVALLVS